MSGAELKGKLENGGYTITEAATSMGKKRQDLSQILNTVSDVKTGLIEDLCRGLNINMFFFYGGSKYLPVSNISSDEQMVPKFMYEELKREMKEEHERMQTEIYEYRDTIKDLQHQISLMQQGMTINEISQKEAG